MSRRHIVGAGASVLLGSRPGAHATPKPSSGRDTNSWFVTSWPAGPDPIVRADRFEVYDGQTLEMLGGFRAVDTGDICLTANPAKILLSTRTGPSIFDLGTGNVTQVTWDTEEPVGAVRLPDPRRNCLDDERRSLLIEDARVRREILARHPPQNSQRVARITR